MASQSERDQLTGHALLSDEGFRRWLLEDPAAAAKSIGIYLNESEASAIKSTDPWALEEAANAVRRVSDGPRKLGGW